MLEVRRRLPSARKAVGAINWEYDISSITLEPCESVEDPLGYRVLFHKDEDAGAKDTYSIGASHLDSRLNKLERAGFYAPMTQKAIDMLGRRRIAFFM